MNPLERSIVATIAYYDGLSMPLRAEEVFEYLIHPSRLSAEEPPRAELSDVIRTLWGAGAGELTRFIGEKNGYYFLRGKDELVWTRQDRQKISAMKWKKVVRAIYLLRFVPFVRMVALAGSMSQDNAKETSDVDIFIVAAHGRIWTCRLLVTGVLSALGVRRSDRGQMTHELVTDKVCLNHYISDRSLMVPYYSMYTAQLYASFIPIIERSSGLFNDFQKANAWIKEYIFSYPREKDHHLKKIGSHTSFSAVRIFERCIDACCGNMMEHWAMRMQKKRIAQHMPGHFRPGRVVTDDFQLEFHPNSPESRIIDNYNQKMSEFFREGFRKEHNSGLS